jgi:hypothetical protein
MHNLRKAFFIILTKNYYKSILFKKRVRGFAMKKLILLIMLAVCVISASAPAWADGRIFKGDVVYEDPSPPKN